MKPKIIASFFFIAFSLLLSAEYIGRLRVEGPAEIQTNERKASGLVMTERMFNDQLVLGNLSLSRFQEDTLLPGHTHHRYQQLHNGLPVYGAQVIVEKENGKVVRISGEYFVIDKLDMTETIRPIEAFQRLAEDLGVDPGDFDPRQHSRAIFPKEDGSFRLCHRVSVRVSPERTDTALVDAQDGSIYARDSNLKFETGIGIGVDYHGVNRKFPHTYEDGVYYLWDEHAIRPIRLATYDMNTGGILVHSNDSYWQGNGVNISAHYHVGLAYDFMYLFLGRKGFNDNNLNIQVVTNRTEYTDNAFWDGQGVNFCKTGSMKAQFAAALDVVAHECAHAVTQFSSDLAYSFQSGALNESFSDIMGSATEIYWQPAGSGFNCADWYIGEDAFPSYSYGINNGFCRYLADPNKFSQRGSSSYPDPCHLTQYYSLPYSMDNGGVHLNMTIYSHAFYLLTAGGTNRISKKSVSGIGLEGALKIFYRAWVYKLTENSSFQHAAQALIDSAYDLYGSGSNEYTQTIRAMEAIGWTVN